MKLILRNTTYYIRKRVPQRFSSVEPRQTVWVSLHTDSEKIASTKASAAWAEMIEAWEVRLAGHSEDAERRFESASELAQARTPSFGVITYCATKIAERLINRDQMSKSSRQLVYAHENDVPAEYLIGFILQIGGDPILDLNNKEDYDGRKTAKRVIKEKKDIAA
ncbi:DUF6538 domain-containing protein [Falsihalocynthiibacter arcticus]|uniref:DUF6538 domain-containing protein n=1 Tax=Falsihalocynthiibacter arcticus TaxID=1579316 RepID=A0A126V0I5_9RHOB|nr:DUF6538 domain-containing protein [Falsihalocynthiibacter arcticus]AML51848.1 hypothetical protein RC74_11745 [Falsihalocynthiibacter arcticus]